MAPTGSSSWGYERALLIYEEAVRLLPSSSAVVDATYPNSNLVAYYMQMSLRDHSAINECNIALDIVPAGGP